MGSRQALTASALAQALPSYQQERGGQIGNIRAAKKVA